jgi:hypothetical protein
MKYETTCSASHQEMKYGCGKRNINEEEGEKKEISSSEKWP